MPPVILGFRARGTLGRAIVDGAGSVKLLHQRIAVNAKVHTLGGFSAHAGQSQLIDWVSNFENRPELYLVHGETEKCRSCNKPFGIVLAGKPAFRNSAIASRSEQDDWPEPPRPGHQRPPMLEPTGRSL